ncbi:hypothetical protein [Hymenobacter psoromatis]|uniref:hypothetical protein n=1 Tax=Hymenobacter psoromatis TaxID=1484116 RepID=UPI001CC0A509|nr:hypothetical protein [Hymenobacter psoromatis]
MLPYHFNGQPLTHILHPVSLNSLMIMPVKTILIAAALSIGLVSCSRGISGVNSSDPYIAQQAQKAQILQDQVDTQKKLVDAEKQKLKSLQLQLDGAKQNLKGRKMAGI